VANCVGERNHGIFWWYLLFELALNLWTFTFTIAEFSGGRASDMKQFLLPALVVCPLFCVLIIGLLFTHSTFALYNRTTFETLSGSHLLYLKDRAAGQRSPFDRGVCFNVLSFCCGCFRPTPIDWAALLEDADGTHASAKGHNLRASDALGLGGALTSKEEHPARSGRHASRGRAEACGCTLCPRGHAELV
jgi:hypothetical protein